MFILCRSPMAFLDTLYQVSHHTVVISYLHRRFASFKCHVLLYPINFCAYDMKIINPQVGYRRMIKSPLCNWPLILGILVYILAFFLVRGLLLFLRFGTKAFCRVNVGRCLMLLVITFRNPSGFINPAAKQHAEGR